MRVLCTHPGKYGDLLWSLPTARAIAEASGEPVDFLVSERYSPILPLLRAQPYIRQALMDPDWHVQNTAPMTPAEPPHPQHLYSGTVVHLGYRRWPQLPLAEEALYTADLQGASGLVVELDKPWITAPAPDRRRPVVVGFTDEWAELKAGLVHSLDSSLRHSGTRPLLLAPPARDSRLSVEFGLTCPMWAADWVQAANLIAGADLFVGCLSSLAVLAAGLGKPRVLIEPNPHRHHEIFQHWDTKLVLGNDGKPTFDARALVAAVKGKLGEVSGAR